MAYGLLLFRKCSLLFFKIHCPSGLFSTYIVTTLITLRTPCRYILLLH